MNPPEPYNPLDKRNLGASVADAILLRPFVPLTLGEPFVGAGIYAIYYVGSTYPPYDRIAALNRPARPGWPIYVGKAVPPGARKGGFGLGADPGKALYGRLAEHAKSIDQARNLRVEQFMCRHLVVDDIWIPLGESLLVRRFSPVWNQTIDGFGNHDPGSGRYNQERSKWDTIHPGRPWALKCATNSNTPSEIEVTLDGAITAYVASVPEGQG